MAPIKTGDRVRFRAGRGYAEGRVANVFLPHVSLTESFSGEAMATICAASGKMLNRKISQLTRVEEVPSQPVSE